MKNVLRYKYSECEPKYVIHVITRMVPLIEADAWNKVSDALTLFIEGQCMSVWEALDDIER